VTPFEYDKWKHPQRFEKLSERRRESEDTLQLPLGKKRKREEQLLPTPSRQVPSKTSSVATHAPSVLSPMALEDKDPVQSGTSAAAVAIVPSSSSSCPPRGEDSKHMDPADEETEGGECYKASPSEKIKSVLDRVRQFVVCAEFPAPTAKLLGHYVDPPAEPTSRPFGKSFNDAEC